MAITKQNIIDAYNSVYQSGNNGVALNYEQLTNEDLLFSLNLILINNGESSSIYNSVNSYESKGTTISATIKNSAGKLYAIECLAINLNNQIKYLQLYDSNTITGTPKRIYPFDGNINLLLIGSEILTSAGLQFNTGITFGFSTTPNTYTPDTGNAANWYLCVRWL